MCTFSYLPYPTDFERSRTRAVGILPPPDAAGPQTPISTHDSATGQRSSPSLRLRSRRSRMRWERQSSVVGVNTDSSQDGPELNERMEPAAAPTTKGDKTKPTDVVDESEELISGADQESPSLLLMYLSPFGQNEARDIERQAIQEVPKPRNKEIKLPVEAQKATQPLPSACKPEVHKEKTEEEGNQSEREVGLEQSEDVQRDECLQRSNRNVDKIVEDVRECKKYNDNNTAEEDNINMDGGDCDIKGAGPLDSCTLVEGLLFPAEYYVRTTRRMASSHSQPDLQAVILSQLNMGRHRRSRGNGRRLTHSRGSNNQTCESGGPCRKSKEADMPHETNGQSSSKNSGQIPTGKIKTDACCSAAVSTPRPTRGRKRKRGRGRGQPLIPQCSFSPDTKPLGLEHTSDNPQLTISPVLLSPSLYGATVSSCSSSCAADEPNSFLTGPVPDDRQHLITPSTAPEHLPSSGTGTRDSPASGHPLYPVFLKNSGMNKSSQLTGSKTCLKTEC